MHSQKEQGSKVVHSNGGFVRSSKMQTSASRKSNGRKRWPMPCVHNQDICSTCKERIVKRITFDIERCIKTKSPVLEKPPKGGHSIYSQTEVGNHEADNALNAMATREKQLNQTGHAKDFFVIQPDWASEKKSPLHVDKVLERLFTQGTESSHGVSNTLDVMMRREKQMDQTRRAKEFFIIHPEWVSEKKSPLRVPKGLDHIRNQGKVRSYPQNSMLNMMMRRELELSKTSRPKEFFIIHPDWVSEKKSPLRV